MFELYCVLRCAVVFVYDVFESEGGMLAGTVQKMWSHTVNPHTNNRLSKNLRVGTSGKIPMDLGVPPLTLEMSLCTELYLCACI